MTNMGSAKTTKKPGTGLMYIGLIVGALGVLLLIAVFGSGGAPTLFVWALPFAGILLAAIGFAMRILAAVERR